MPATVLQGLSSDIVAQVGIQVEQQMEMEAHQEAEVTVEAHNEDMATPELWNKPLVPTNTGVLLALRFVFSPQTPEQEMSFPPLLSDAVGLERESVGENGEQYPLNIGGWLAAMLHR